MTNRFLISRFVGKALLMPLMPVLMALGVVAVLAAIVVGLPAYLLFAPISALLHSDLSKDAWRRLTGWTTYRYHAGDDGWMARKSVIDRDWLIVRNCLYITEGEAVKAIKREAAEPMRTRHNGCTLAVRIYQSRKTRKVEEVNFRIEQGGVSVACRLGDRELSQIEHQIRRLPIIRNHSIERDKEYDDDEIKMAF